MIASIDDPESLQDLRRLILEFMGNQVQESDYWEEMSDLEKGELEEALLESEDDANHVDHELVMERYKKWLEK